MLNNKSSNWDDNDKKIYRHPCFNNYEFHSAVLHLPVAAESNITYQKNILIDKYVTTSCMDTDKSVLTSKEAIERFIEVRKSIPNLMVAAISGPGEALANFDAVKEVFKRIRHLYPNMLLCLSTNGLMLPVYANHLISLGVNSIAVTVNTINPETGAKIYDNITYLGHKYLGLEGAKILLQNQIAGLRYLASMDIAIRMNINVIKGINDHEIKDIIKFAKGCGCKITNVIDPLSEDNNESGLESFYSDNLSDMRREYEKIMPQSYFCKVCNACSVESLNYRFSFDFSKSIQYQDNNPHKEVLKFRFAVCSKNGRLIDQHFGFATKFYIYDYIDDEITYLETRPVKQYSLYSKEEKANSKIYRLIKAIEDCNCVICTRIGACPANTLKEKNINTYTTYNLIEDGIREAVSRVYWGKSIEVI